MEKITVLSGAIMLNEISATLLEDGIVVLETMRSHAEMLAKSMEEVLDIDSNDEDGLYLIHLSAKLSDRGWSNFIVYSGMAEYEPGVTQEAVRKAVSSWLNAGSPDKHVANINVQEGSPKDSNPALAYPSG